MFVPSFDVTNRKVVWASVLRLTDRAEATAGITDSRLQGMLLRRILDGICRVTYENNPGKLAAWLQAAHTEKPPEKPKPPTP